VTPHSHEGLTPPPVAIETYYHGYQCRSRLEARWIVFFESIGIQFYYEPEGYKLPSGWYLPDLFLPQIRMWAEVKPMRFTAVEKDKCKELVDATGHPCLLLPGPPEFTTYRAVHSLNAEEGNSLGDARWECSYLLDIDYHARKYYEKEQRLFSCGVNEFNTELMFSDEYGAAIRAARCERFTGEAA
jgi:hypothetical protein